LPAVLTVAEAPATVNPLGPVQLYVTPDVEELPVSTTFLTEQVNWPLAGTLLVTTAAGCAVSVAKAVDEVDVHPVDALVAVTL